MTAEFIAAHVPDDWTSVQDLARHLTTSHQLSKCYQGLDEYGVGNTANAIVHRRKELEESKVAEFGTDGSGNLMIKSASKHEVGYPELHTREVGNMLNRLTRHSVPFATTVLQSGAEADRQRTHSIEALSKLGLTDEQINLVESAILTKETSWWGEYRSKTMSKEDQEKYMRHDAETAFDKMRSPEELIEAIELVVGPSKAAMFKEEYKILVAKEQMNEYYDILSDLQYSEGAKSQFIERVKRDKIVEI